MAKKLYTVEHNDLRFNMCGTIHQDGFNRPDFDVNEIFINGSDVLPLIRVVNSYFVDYLCTLTAEKYG